LHKLPELERLPGILPQNFHYAFLVYFHGVPLCRAARHHDYAG
jgi:hypothetical protein